MKIIWDTSDIFKNIWSLGVPESLMEIYFEWNILKYSEFFNELNSLQGCTASSHSNVKPPEPEKPITDEKPLGLDEVSML